MSINTFNLAELIILAVFLSAWVIGATYLIWARVAKGKSISRSGVFYWLGFSTVVIILKLALIEYRLHLSDSEAYTEFWSRTFHLIYFEGELSVLTGAVYAESANVWRLLFYPTVVIVSLISTAPLLGIRMRPTHS